MRHPLSWAPSEWVLMDDFMSTGREKVTSRVSPTLFSFLLSWGCYEVGQVKLAWLPMLGRKVPAKRACYWDVLLVLQYLLIASLDVGIVLMVGAKPICTFVTLKSWNGHMDKCGTVCQIMWCAVTTPRSKSPLQAHITIPRSKSPS